MQLAKEFGQEFNKHIDQYLERIVNQVREDIGKCWPMSQAYNATIVAGCKKILNPYVSYWIFISLFLWNYTEILFPGLFKFKNFIS